MADYASEADPRFADAAPERPGAHRRTGALAGDSKKKPPRIAFTGEEFGFGYQATEIFLKRARERRTVYDGGLLGLGAHTEREYDEASKNGAFDYARPISQPLRSKELALMAVKQGTADFAIVPFYSPHAGYDFESLRALASLRGILGVEQVEATDSFCLAVHESQLYDLIQSAHPGTGFSALQRRFRNSWGTVDAGSGNTPGSSYDAEMARAGLPIDMADQKLIRDRIDMVFAGPEAARRCKSKLDGLRVLGVSVQETPQVIEPHRELARLARSSTNAARQTSTVYDPISREVRHFSSLGAEAQNGKLFGMVLPYEVAMRSSDYVIIDHKFDDAPSDAPSEKTRFMVVEVNPDHTLSEDAYRTTDARTRYWVRRLEILARQVIDAGFFTRFASVFILAGFALSIIGAARLLGWNGLYPLFPATPQAATLTNWAATIGGLMIALFGFVKSVVASTAQEGRGVRVMLRFRRDGAAASIGDVENYLRNFAVRHSVVRLNEDSGEGQPADILFDVEFDAVDFDYNPFRRLRGTIVNGALKQAFARWKDRGVLVLAAMPFDSAQQQLPKHAPRRWWKEGLIARLKEVAETLQIRLSRVLLYYVFAPAVALGLLRVAAPKAFSALVAGVADASDAAWTSLARLFGL